MNIPQIWCEDLVRIYSTDEIEVQALSSKDRKSVV